MTEQPGSPAGQQSEARPLLTSLRGLGSGLLAWLRLRLLRPMRWLAAHRPNLVRWLWWLLIFAALALYALVVIQTWAAPRPWDPASQGGFAHWRWPGLSVPGPVRAAQGLAAVLALLAGMATIARRHRLASLIIPVAGTLAVGAGLLGMAAYLPCQAGRDALPFVSALGWTLELFVGGAEGADSPAGACIAGGLPGFELAQTAALLAIFVGAVGAWLVFGRAQIDRWRIYTSADVDIVVGLDGQSLPLVAALVAESRGRPKRERWILRRPGIFSRDMWAGLRGRQSERAPIRYWLFGLRSGDIKALLAPRTKVVVLDADAANPHMARARELGAVVYVGDPRSPQVMRRLVTTRFPPIRAVALRRMYLVDQDLDLNVAAAQTVSELLTDRLRPHRRGVVPRVLVRFDDQWECWAYRNSMLSVQASRETDPPGLRQIEPRAAFRPVFDGVTSHDLVVQEIIEVLLPQAQTQWRVDRLTLVGSDPIWRALVNEIHLQAWCRWEERYYYQRRNPGSAGPANVTPAPVVRLVSPDAGEMATEWHKQRPPWAFPEGMPGAGAGPDVIVEFGTSHSRNQVALPDRPERSRVAQPRVPRRRPSGEQPAQPEQMAWVYLDATPQMRQEANRRARINPDVLVFVADPDAVGLSQPPAAGAPYRFGPSWTRTEPGCARAVAVTDSMTRLARQQHTAPWSNEWRNGGGDNWLTGPPLDKVDARGKKVRGKVAGVPWSRLPDFYREDNVRQHWHLLQWFAFFGYQWRAVVGPEAGWPTPDNFVAEVLSQQGWTDLSQSEYARWSHLRYRTGWLRRGETRYDSLRIHNELGGLQHADELNNAAQMAQILARMWAVGVFPVPLQAACRTGLVTATRVHSPTKWVADTGVTYRALPGDWQVKSDSGEHPHYVPAAAFGTSHEEVGGDGYRRTGASPVRYRRVPGHEVVHTPDGIVVTRPRDIVISRVIVDKGWRQLQEWPVSQEWFATGYVACDRPGSVGCRAENCPRRGPDE